MNAIDRATAGSAAAPLSKHQRRVMMTRFVIPAWKAMRRRGLAGPDLEDWRREEQFKACHREHLRASTQADWLPLCAHFLRIQGRTEAASNIETRVACGGLAVARQKLRGTLAEAASVIERPEAYAEAIARRQYGAPIADLGERQVWSLVYTMRNRMHARAGGRG